jgi:hypothetical protein
MRLFRTVSVEGQWRAVVAPWLRGPAAEAWKDARPTVLVTPSRAESFYLRGRLVEEGVGYLGVRFWTPSDARHFLHGRFPADNAATLADLRLLARVAVAQTIRTADANRASVTSVEREPAAFLRAYELLIGAGWDPARDGSSYARELAASFQRLLRERDLATQAEVHRELSRQAQGVRAKPLAHVLLVGFNAVHWPIWDLLKAVCLGAEQAAVALLEPRTFGEEVDQLWFNSWEEIAGSPAEIAPANADEAANSLADLAASYERGSEDRVQADCAFCVTPDVTTQVRAVVLHILDFLRRDNCTRLGVVFAGASALALGVAAALRELEIPLNDGPGRLEPGPFERRHWLAWLALQEEPGVAALIEWVRASEAAGASVGAESGLKAAEIAEAVSGALGETLVDDLGFLAAHLQAWHPGRRRAIVGEFLRARIALPIDAPFDHFLQLTRRAIDRPGWEDQLARLELDPPAWLHRWTQVIDRRAFLDWLRESTASHARTHGRDGDHYYGRVHLLVYGQAAGQTWSHLILTGLNEGVWPRADDDDAFSSRHELTALNEAARGLNRRATATGSQGDGQVVVRAGLGHCLLAQEQQDLALRDLVAMVESTREALCLTAVSTDNGRTLLPSDFFNHAYQAVTGEGLDEEAFRHLANRTASWCARHDGLFAAGASALAADVEPTRAAHLARRDRGAPFGRYEYAFAEPPPEPIQLACKRWEAAWRHPSGVWMTDIVGVSMWPEGTMAWEIATGTWVHRWLAAALDECRRDARSERVAERLHAAAERERVRTREGARVAGVALYPWWEQVWSQARTIATVLAEQLQPLLPGQLIWPEYRLGERILIALPGSLQADFSLSGRLDLLLIQHGTHGREPTERDLTGFDCWVIDFKTGSAGKLSEKTLENGTGLQALLYAMAVRALGAASTGVSIVSPTAPAQIQVKLTGGGQFLNVLRSLQRMHGDGIFGRRPAIHEEYVPAPNDPMATRPVAKEILEAKWALLHGAETREEA